MDFEFSISESPKHAFREKFSHYKIILQFNLKNHILKIRTPPTHATGEFTVDKAHTSLCLLSINSQSSKGVKSRTRIPVTPCRK